MKELTFKEALTRLNEIVAEVQKKETDIEKSVELLEEGLKLANYCTQNIGSDGSVGAAASDLKVNDVG
jgi:exodeoxyribonuclease VII small subunit